MTPKNMKPNWRILHDFRLEHVGWLGLAVLLVASLGVLSAVKLRKAPTVPREPADLGLSTKAVQINPITREIELVELSKL